jgi:hypothetical protein
MLLIQGRLAELVIYENNAKIMGKTSIDITKLSDAAKSSTSCAAIIKLPFQGR